MDKPILSQMSRKPFFIKKVIIYIALYAAIILVFAIPLTRFHTRLGDRQELFAPFPMRNCKTLPSKASCSWNIDYIFYSTISFLISGAFILYNTTKRKNNLIEYIGYSLFVICTMFIVSQIFFQLIEIAKSR